MKLSNKKNFLIAMLFLSSMSFCFAGDDNYKKLMSERFNIKNPDYVLGVESPMKRISYAHPLLQFSGEVRDTYYLRSARHEYESFQINIMPLTKGLNNIKIEFSDLINKPAQGVIDKSHVKFYVEGFVETKKSWPVPDELLGWKPDPLLIKSSFNVTENREQPVWVTIYTPLHVASGRYEGTMLIKPENSHSVTLKLVLDVWNFDLPRAGHLRTPTTFDEELVEKFYGYDTIPDTVLKDYYDILLDHRIDPTSLYHSHVSPRERMLEYCIVEKGLRTITLGYLPPKIKLTADHERLLKLKEITAFLKDKGWLDKAVVYIGDEVGAETYETLKNNARLIKEHCPGLKIMAGIAPKEDLFGSVDIWDPIMTDNGEMAWNRFIPEVCLARQKAGDEVMWYVAAAPSYPYPNVMMDNPLVDSRMLFWITWKYGVTGFEYYYINLWRKNVEGVNGRKWPAVLWDTYSFVSARNSYNGDGMLIYPGPNGKPYSSVRLENIRDGIEDYECFWLLKERLDELIKRDAEGKYKAIIAETQAILKIQDAIIKDMSDFTRDPQKIVEARDNLSRQIEKLEKIIKNAGN